MTEARNTDEQGDWLKQCRCGHNRHHYLVEPVCSYNWWGWVRLTLGVTAWPLAVHYKCLQCGDLIETTTDPEILSQQV